jgi:hypothetical protein
MTLERSGRLAALASLLAALVGCSGGGGGNNTGTLTLGLTDGPVEGAKNVIVAFTGVELKPKGGGPMDVIPMDAQSCDTFDAATGTCSIDLLDLVGRQRRVVFSRNLPAGDYEWVRLLVKAQQNVMDSYINTLDGKQCSLWIPSGSETGLKIVSGITVTANGVSDYTLDFDVRKSITNPPGQAGTDPALLCADNYVMKPAIRIVDSTEVGAIAGTVADSVLAGNASCTLDGLGHYQNVAAYVFEDVPGYVADDLDGDAGDPITSASVKWDDMKQAYAYEVGYLLAPATYHVALTCTADVDEALVDDYDPSSQSPQPFGFVAEQAVDVAVNATADGSF